MGQHIELLAPTPDDLISVSRTHGWKRTTDFLSCPPTQTSCHSHYPKNKQTNQVLEQISYYLTICSANCCFYEAPNPLNIQKETKDRPINYLKYEKN